MKLELPIYKVNIDAEDTFMSAISLVDYPAVEHNFLCFDETKPIILQFADDEKHILTGVVCLADTPIYRRDKTGEYYLVFTKDVIEQMAYKYSKMGLWNSVNLQHNELAFTDDVTMVELYIKNIEQGINPSAFQDVPEGSLFASYKVTDENLWKAIRTTSHFNGFSLEIYANRELMKDETKTKSYDMNKMSLIDIITLGKIWSKLSTIDSDLGPITVESIEEGASVYIEDAEGNTISATDGEYLIEEGKRKLIVTEGKISKIDEVEEKKDEAPAEETPSENAEPVADAEAKKRKCEDEAPVEEAPADDKDAKIAELIAEIADKEAKIAELEAELEALKSAPVETEMKKVTPVAPFKTYKH